MFVVVQEEIKGRIEKKKKAGEGGKEGGEEEEETKEERLQIQADTKLH